MEQGSIHINNTQLRADILSQFSEKQKKRKNKRMTTQNNNEQLQYRVYNFPSDFVAHIGMHILRAYTERDSYITMRNITNCTIWNHNNLSEMSKRSTKMYLESHFSWLSSALHFVCGKSRVAIHCCQLLWWESHDDLSAKMTTTSYFVCMINILECTKGTHPHLFPPKFMPSKINISKHCVNIFIVIGL